MQTYEGSLRYSQHLNADVLNLCPTFASRVAFYTSLSH